MGFTLRLWSDAEFWRLQKSEISTAKLESSPLETLATNDSSLFMKYFSPSGVVEILLALSMLTVLRRLLAPAQGMSIPSELLDVFSLVMQLCWVRVVVT